MTSAKTVEQGNKPHYAWLVMIAYGLMMSGTIGSFSVVGAQWFYPVSTDIGCELSTLTLYTTIEMVCMGLAMPLVGNLLTRVKLPVILIAAVAMEVLATVAMAFYDEPWMWYVSGVFVGLGLAATSTVTVTPTMGNWFAKKTGFAIGVVWAIQALYCAVASPLFATIIEAIGWRSSYFVLAAASACLALPAIVFVIRYRPEDKGLLPYGYEEAAGRAENPGSQHRARRAGSRSVPQRAVPPLRGRGDAVPRDGLYERHFSNLRRSGGTWRGGGRTDGVLGEPLRHCLQPPGGCHQ